MLTKVPVQIKDIDQYRSVVGDEIIDRLKEKAAELTGARVVHINSTAYGGGVAEMLYTLVPLMSSLGLQAEWQVIRGSDEFFTITKLFHNALQGMEIPTTLEMQQHYLRAVAENASLFEGEYDFVIVHDPQPCALAAILDGTEKRRGRWIWRCHIDTTFAQEDAWEFLLPFINFYDAAIFTKDDYIKTPLRVRKIAFIPPSIDPLSPKNMMPSRGTQEFIAHRYGVDLLRPLILQVSRFDPWKDPLGAVDTYRLVKEYFPGVQLVFLASMASDDPEGWHYYEKINHYSGDDPDIHLLSNLQGIGNLEVSAFQAASTVILQKSLREGFGLTVTEGMWKSKPVVAGRVGGILLQIDEGINGFLVDDPVECAERVVDLLSDDELRERIGRAAHEKVFRYFLCTRHLMDYLELFGGLMNR
jgi:trehalose synthase